MADVTQEFIRRWRSGDHVGDARPLVSGFVRRGHFERGYLHTNNPLNVHIPGSAPSEPWRARWVPEEPFTVLPNILSYNIEQDFEQHGIHTCSLVIENLIYKETPSPFGGIYHLIERGYLAPLRGYDSGSPIPTVVQRRNEWFQRLSSNVEILILAGYGGGEPVPVFQGLTDDVDMGARPDRITITARDFGQTLTDQNLFGYNKDPHIRDPVTFADKKDSDTTTYEAAGARASSTFRGHPASNVIDQGKDAKKTEWWSENRGAGNITQWCQITVPAGRYESIYLDVPYPNMECFIGIFGYAQRGKDGTYYVAEGEDKREHPQGWYNPDGSLPIVPGEHGDWPYFKHYPDLQHNGKQVPFGRSFHLGPNSKIRVGFRNLYKVRDNHGTAPDDYRAGIRRLWGVQRVLNPELKEGQAILVNDVSDIVKVVLRWAGFEEWDVQDTGTRLGTKTGVGAPVSDGRVTYNRGTFLIDIIRDIAEKTGFVFSMREPSNVAAGSIGVPVFRQTASIQDNAIKGVVRDTDVLTGVQAKITDDPLSTIIRVRGKEAPRSKGGITVGAQSTTRLTGSYRPPWTRGGRLAGLNKHRNVNRFDLDNPTALRFACVLIALYEALQSTTATLEMAGTPQFELNDQAMLQDLATGLNTRMWIARRTMTYQGGEATSWKTTLGGSLIDTPDIAEIKRDITDLFANPIQSVAEQAPTVIGSRPQPTTSG